MRSETGHISTQLAVLALIVTICAAMLAVFSAPWWSWLMAALWWLAWLSAALGLADGPSRAFLAGTLRKSSFTQIYTGLTKRNVMWLWARLCDPVDNRARAVALLRAATTWRLYDFAMVFALVYPIALPVGQWLFMGEAARIGNVTVLEETRWWPERLSILLVGSLTLLPLLFVAVTPKEGPKTIVNGRSLKLRMLALITFLCAPLIILLPYQIFSVSFLLFICLFFLNLMFYPGSQISLFQPASWSREAYLFGIASGGFSAATVVGVAVVAWTQPALWIAAFISPATYWAAYFNAAGHPTMGRVIASFGNIITVALVCVFADWSKVEGAARFAFLMLSVLPLLNALFDTASYAVTLTFLRRGVRARLPLVWGLADLAVACGLFIGLGATLVAAVHGLNMLAGVPLVDLGALFAGLRETPGAYWWLYLMLFSTILPTAVHVAVSLLGVQGIWPRTWRRPVAAWVEAAPDSPLEAVRAGLGLSVVWTLPVLLLGAILWALWIGLGGAVTAGLDAYLRALLWIADVPVGAL